MFDRLSTCFRAKSLRDTYKNPQDVFLGYTRFYSPIEEEKDLPHASKPVLH